jgi:hypothetical protein
VHTDGVTVTQYNTSLFFMDLFSWLENSRTAIV